MAEFVTKRENTRRLVIVIACIIVDAVALAVGIYALKGAADLEKKHPENIIKVQGLVVDQRAKNEAHAAELRRFSRPVGWHTWAVGTTDRFETSSVDHEQLRKYLSGWVVELRKLQITKYRGWDEQAAGEPLTLTALLSELEAKEKEYRDAIAKSLSDITAEREKDKLHADDVSKRSDELRNQLDGKAAANEPARGLIGEYIKLIKELNALQKAHQDELVQLEVETVAKQTEATTVKNENVRKRTSYDGSKGELRKRILTIQHDLVEKAERRDADGQVLGVNSDREICYINLLHKDRLFKGTRFTVYALERAGEKIPKGEIEVIEVRRDVSSVCAITKTVSPDHPIRPGDRFYNELYEGARAKYVAFAGRFTGKLSNEEAAAVVREFGDHWQEKVDEKTNYLVVGQGFEDHPNYKLAVEFNVKILREKVLYDYLGVK